VFFFAGAFGPLVSAGILTWVTGDSLREWARQALEWRVRPRWYVAALGLPLVFTTLPLTVAFAALGTPIEPSLLLGRLPTVVIGMVFVFFLGGGQEELGWRGFALPRLQQSYSALGASLIIGVVWAIWHLPLFFTAWGDSQLPFPVYSIALVALSVLFTWLYNNTRGSVLLTMMMHASFNSANGLVPLPPEAVTPPLPLSVILPYVGAMWVIALVAIGLYGRDLTLEPLPKLGVTGRYRGP
jgi:membrane protease YdiL (CAAX protease family)